MSQSLLSDPISASFLYDLLFCKTINLSVSQFLSSWMWQQLLITEGCILKKMEIKQKQNKNTLKLYKLILHFLSHLFNVTIQYKGFFFLLPDLVETSTSIKKRFCTTEMRKKILQWFISKNFGKLKRKKSNFNDPTPASGSGFFWAALDLHSTIQSNSI